MTKKIVWRLKEQPTTESLRNLVKDGVLTKDEAREILMSHEDNVGNVGNQENTLKDMESLREEVKFLRKLVDTLSQNQATRVIEYIEKYPVPYRSPWYEPYRIYCQNTMQYDAKGMSLEATNLASLN